MKQALLYEGDEMKCRNVDDVANKICMIPIMVTGTFN